MDAGFISWSSLPSRSATIVADSCALISLKETFVENFEGPSDEGPSASVSFCPSEIPTVSTGSNERIFMFAFNEVLQAIKVRKAMSRSILRFEIRC